MVNEEYFLCPCLMVDSPLGTIIHSYYLWIPESTTPSYFFVMAGVPFYSSPLPTSTGHTPIYFSGLNLRTIFLGGTLSLITFHPPRITILSLSAFYQSTGYIVYISLSFSTLVYKFHIA